MAGKHSKKLFEKSKKSVTVPAGAERKSVSIPVKIIISATAISLLISLIFVTVYFVPGKLQERIMSQASQIFESSHSYNEALQALAADNADIKGWLKIENTQINAAVCQTDNDSYYITHNQKGKKSRYGALFLSSTDTFERGEDKNIAIYGNNMKDGSMFGTLKKYRNLQFYMQNPVVNLYYGENAEKYMIFAVMIIDSSSENNENYNPLKGYFTDENDFNDWYGETLQRSLINTTVTAAYGDEMLSLITAVNDFNGARLVVTAKKVTEGQTLKADVSGASVNPKIKYPKAWYEQRNLKYPY